MTHPALLCQPDRSKGCCACCGLFNFQDISRDNLSQFLSEGRKRSACFLSRDDTTGIESFATIRDPASYICPHQGFLSKGRPGCLLHPRYRSLSKRHHSFFGETICGGFICPAHYCYTVEEQRLIIQCVEDWYYYSIALIDPESTQWFLSYIDSRYGINALPKQTLKRLMRLFLEIHADALSRFHGPIFHYSVAEYRTANKQFSLSSDNPCLEPERRMVRAEIDHACELS